MVPPMLVLAGLFGYINAWAQAPDLSRSLPEIPEGYWLQAEVYAEHSSGALEGMTTYRVWRELHGAFGLRELLLRRRLQPAPPLTGDAVGTTPCSTPAPLPRDSTPCFTTSSPRSSTTASTIGAEDATTPASMHPGSVWGEIDATEESTATGTAPTSLWTTPKAGRGTCLSRSGDG